MTVLDELVEEKQLVDDDGNHDKFAHYVRKDELERAIFDGIPVVALCGKKWLPFGDYKAFPICPTCKEIWSTFPIN
jgi:hypothetical protein